MWWIDVVGSCQVRSFAIGGGKPETNSKDNNSSNDNNRMVAHVLNQQPQCLDFNMTAQEGVLCMLKAFAGQTQNDSNGNSSPMLVLACSEMEMASADKTIRGKPKRFSPPSTTEQQEQHA